MVPNRTRKDFVADEVLKRVNELVYSGVKAKGAPAVVCEPTLDAPDFNGWRGDARLGAVVYIDMIYRKGWILSLEDSGYGKSENIWTDTRKDILRGLSELSDSVFEHLYRCAIERIAVYDPELVTARVDLAIIAHCVRELMNRLPDCLGGEKFDITTKSGLERQSEKKLRQMLIEWCDDSTFSISDNSSIVSIPANLAKALSDYGEAVKMGSLNNRKKASVAVLGHIDESNPALSSWLEVQHFFMGYAHISEGSRQLPTYRKVIQEIAYLENCLVSRLGYFFKVKSMLRATLDKANAKLEDGSFSTPSAEEVQSTLSLIGNEGLRFMFFSELKNPEWFEGLKRRQVFNWNGAQGESKEVNFSWSEVAYLKNVASLIPHQITEVLLRAANQPRFEVRHAVIELALLLPEECVVNISDHVARWAKDGYGAESYFWVSDKVFDFIDYLLKFENQAAINAGKRIFEACFMPHRIGGIFSGVHALIPEYCYSEKMEQLESAIDLLSLTKRRAIFNSFSMGLLYEMRNGAKSSDLIPSVEDAVCSHTCSIANEVLFQFVRILRLCLIEDARATLEWAKKKADNPLAMRCVLYAIKLHLEACGKGSCIDDAIADYVRDVLTAGYVLESEFDPELYPMFKLAYTYGVATSDEIDDIFLAAHQRMLERYRKGFDEIGWGANESPEDWANRWIHRAFSLIGQDCLGSKGKAFYEELSATIPCEAYSAKHVYEGETLTGPNSPIDYSAMLEMGATMLIEHLADWHPVEDDRMKLISHEGQGRILAQVVGKNPHFFSGNVQRLIELRPLYRRKIMDGWAEAVKNGRVIPLDDALAMMEHASTMPEGAQLQGEGDRFDDDWDYLALRRSAAYLAEALLDCEILAFDEGQADLLLNVTMTLAESDEPNAEYMRQYGESMDALEVSGNTTRPIALLGIAKWAYRFKGHARLSCALRIFDDHFPDVSTCTAEAAAIGQALPYLYTADPLWAQTCYGRLFGDQHPNTCQQIVLTIVLSAYRPSKRLFDFLSPAMFAALENCAEQYAMGTRLTARNCLLLIGDWLYVGYAFGFVHKDDGVLNALWSKANADYLGSILKRLCAKVNQNVSKDVAERVGELWDYHANKLVKSAGNTALLGVEHLVRSRSYEVEWWGPRLLREIRLNPHEIPIFFIDDDLVDLSRHDSQLAVEILHEVLRLDRNPIPVHYEELGFQLLSFAKQGNGGELSSEATRCLDALGEIGCVDLDERLG